MNFKHELIGCIGMPISENPTGVMQEAAFKALGLPFRYLLVEGEPERLAEIVAGFKALKFAGANFTIPNKAAVIQYLDEISTNAKLMGAVNTVRIGANGAWIGENTDGQGFIQSLAQINVDPKGKKITVLGAGGAARAICVELAMLGAKQINIINRTASRAEPLVNLINNKTPADATFQLWTKDHRVPTGTDILINATSIGLYPSTDKPEIDYGSVTSNMIVCDVIPNPPRTKFLAEADKIGARTLDGLGMLVFQGAIAFEMWTGENAPTEIMRAALEDVFS